MCTLLQFVCMHLHKRFYVCECGVGAKIKDEFVHKRLHFTLRVAEINKIHVTVSSKDPLHCSSLMIHQFVFTHEVYTHVL